MADEFDIFNLGVSDIETYDVPKGGNSDLYKPTADQGKDGVYSSLIRFLPNPKNPSKSLIRKFVYWLEDGNGNGAYFDSPSTVGDKCPVQDLFFKLRNSESAVDRKMSEKLKRREIFYSLVQVIKDPQDPSQEGQIKVFKFGYKIKQKIDEELNPQFDEPTQVFDLFDGKNFELKITKQGGYNSYDSSKFQGKKSAIEIKSITMEPTEEHKKMIMDYLKDAPDLGSFDYKAWDDETRNKVNNVLDQYRSPGSATGTVTGSAPSKPAASAPVKKAEAPVVESEDTDNLDDFLNGLDL
jgi:hypothetical protein